MVKYENNKKVVEKAETVFNILDKNNSSSFVKMKPITGRKHQIEKKVILI